MFKQFLQYGHGYFTYPEIKSMPKCEVGESKNVRRVQVSDKAEKYLP